MARVAGTSGPVFVPDAAAVPVAPDTNFGVVIEVAAIRGDTERIGIIGTGRGNRRDQCQQGEQEQNPHRHPPPGAHFMLAWRFRTIQEPRHLAAAVPIPAPEHPHEPILLDASNIVHRAGGGEPGFRVLCSLEQALGAAGWEVYVVADASLRHKIGDAAGALEDRLEAGGWMQVPKGHSADRVLLAEAARLAAWVVSDDQFRDHQAPPARRLSPGLLMGAL